MKKVKQLLIVAAITIAANVTAQAQKVAHINVSELIQSMPEYKSSQEQLKKLNATFEADYKKMVEAYQTKLKKYSDEAATAGDATNEKRGQELQEDQQRIVQFEQNAQKELAKKTEELQVPILDKAQKAIHKVARANGYEYVLDSTTGSGLILADGPNLLGDVQKELKVK